MSMTEYTQNEVVSYLNGKTEGERAERERILALLEEWLADDHGDFDVTLARIKEGNK